MQPDLIRILHLEDSDLDADYVRQRLILAGLPVQIDRVADRDSFVSRLEQNQYDVILSDYQVPTFEHLAALELARELCPDTPFLFVSGAMGEELAVESLHRGATDYILKERLTRLPAAVERALDGARQLLERRAAEAAYRESEERFRLLAESTPNLAWTARPDGHIFWFNERWYQYTGTTPADVEGWGWQSVHDPEVLPAVLDEWKRSLDTGAPFEMVYPLRGADGDYHPFLTRILPLRDSRGSIIYWFGTNTDISTQVRAEQELREADRRKDEFLATLAHELRNPLAPIRNGLEILKHCSGDQPDATQTRNMMQRQLEHLVRLVDDLLDVARVSQGKVKLKHESLELHDIVENALEVSQSFIDSAGHRLFVSIPNENLFVTGDATRLAQVITNLLHNAAKYTPEGGRIELSIERDGRDVRIRVSDNGMGIPGEMLPRVFDLFTQVGRSIDRAQGGLGIGLSLVRKLVELHGGWVSGESAGIGHGSTFTVSLPLATRQVPFSQGDGMSTSNTAKPAAQRILIVDDNVDAATSLGLLLKLTGHETQVGHSGPAALELVASFGPDAIFLDIGLPGMNGYEVARTIRSMARIRQPYLIALTGWGSDEDKRLAKEVGFDQHLTKPIDAGAVNDVLRRLSTARAAEP